MKKNQSFVFALATTLITLSGAIDARNSNLEVHAHIESYGDIKVKSGQTTKIGRHEAIMLRSNLPNGSLEYDCHIENYGDWSVARNYNRWTQENVYCGTFGESKRMESIAIRLTRAAASGHSVHYACLQGGKWYYNQDGGWCGKKRQSRAIEKIKVWFEPNTRRIMK